MSDINGDAFTATCTIENVGHGFSISRRHCIFFSVQMVLSVVTSPKTHLALSDVPRCTIKT